MAHIDSEITIRRALVADTDAVLEIWWGAKDEIPLTPRFEKDSYRAWVRDNCRKKQVWLAAISNDIAGVMVMDDAKIFYLVTVPSFHRNGVGHALVRHAIDMVKKRYRCGVKIEVCPTNSRMLAFLKKEAFLPHPTLTANGNWVVYFFGNVP